MNRPSLLDRLRRLPAPLWFVYAGTTVNRLGAFVFPFLTIYLMEGRGLSFTQVGWILSIGSVGLLFGNLAGGWLTDRWSRKGTLLLALMINVLGFLGLSGRFEPVWTYAAFLFVGYVGTGLFGPAASTIIADLTTPEERPIAYTVNYVCTNLGMGLGPLLGGVLAATSYRLLFLGDIATSLACAALIYFGVRGMAQPIQDEPGQRQPMISIWLRHRLVFAFCLANFFLIAPLMGLEFAVPLLVKSTFASAPVYIGAVYTINAVCILALGFLVERIVRGRNEMLVMALSGLLWSVGLGILLAGFSMPALLLCTAVWTLGEIIASIVVPTFISRSVRPEVKGRFLALVDAMRSLAGIVCPITLGGLWEREGVLAAMVLILALPLAGTLAYLALFAWTSTSPSLRSLETDEHSSASRAGAQI